MGNKRKCNESERIKNKIRKLECQLQKRKRLIVYSDSETESESNNSGLDTVHVVNDPIALTSSNTRPLHADSTSSITLELNADAQDSIPQLDSEILALLGEAPKSDIKFGKPTYKELACRWQEILEKGLPKDLKEKLLEEYLIPENCTMLVPPSLNPEVKAALADNLVKRDTSLLTKQKQISVAIAALNQAIEMIISKESQTKILKPISDACRLLCDGHFSDTRTGRGFVLSSISPDMKETLIETKHDNLLFGEDISEKLKSTKLMKRSAADLKQTRNDKSHIFNKNNFIKSNKGVNNRLNWKTMPRKAPPKTDMNKPRQNQRQSTYTGSQQRGHRETSERRMVPGNTRRR